MNVGSAIIGGRWRAMMCQRRRVKMKQKGVSKLYDQRRHLRVSRGLTRLKPAPTSRRRLWSQLCRSMKTGSAYVLSKPFANPPHTSPAQTLRNTCQQAFPISIPPAHWPHRLKSRPYTVLRSHGDPSSVGHKFAT